MTVGLPGAGIGGLFYLASTLLLPVRSLVRRWRGRPDNVTWRGQAYLVLLALGIIGSLWLAGWLLDITGRRRLCGTLRLTEGCWPKVLCATEDYVHLSYANFAFGTTRPPQ